MKPLAKPPALDPVAVKVREIGALIEKREGLSAEQAALNLLKAHPNRPDVHNILGVAYVQLRRRGKAVPHFEAAVKAEPNNPVYLNNLGRLYLDLDLIELALPPLNRALAINPKLSESLWAIGEYYRDVGKAEVGLPYFERALRVDRENLLIKGSRGESLEALGRVGEAKQAFEELLQDPRMKVMALFRLSELEQPTTDSPYFAEASRLIESAEISDTDRSRLHSALAHFYENSEKYARAFEHYLHANAVQNLSFDLENFRSWIDALIATFTPDVFAKRRDLGLDSEVPVFVVGMPRSGTTLTEQIIANHPRAGGAGELVRLIRFSDRLGYRDDPRKFLENFDALGAKRTRELSDNFLDLLKFHAPKATRIVDKMPHNFERLGFIALLFPRAKIIHCRRNPADTCWSCFQNRLNKAHSYSKDLTTLGLYYREYSRLMEHWQAVLPMAIYQSHYEELTAEPEESVRRILEFIGLEWNPACLEFHKKEATISTLSRKQIRNPVYRTSVERWRRYEQELKPLIAALGDVMESGPAPGGRA
jgi:tetratricopeptide (TPR) repeat protein